MKEKDYVFNASYQPQVREKRDTRTIMLDVLIALIPAMAVGVWQFGMKVLLLLVVSVAASVFFEWLYRKLMHKNCMIGDLSAAVTGVLIVLTLPVTTPWWVVVIADLFSIIIVKQLYGGLGKNFLNPALAGRAFVFFSYTKLLSSWSIPASLQGVELGKAAVDATTMATPLSFMKAGAALPECFSLKAMFLGTMPGCIGEISALALIVGGAYLLIRKVISWHIPAAYLGSVALLCLIFGKAGYSNFDWMLLNLCSGGLMLGAFFMATDYATSPVTNKGRVIYGIGCGALTVLIRYFGGFPEGVTFAILIMNTCAWFLDKLNLQRQFGVTAEDVKAAKAAKKAAAKAAKEGA